MCRPNVFFYLRTLLVFELRLSSKFYCCDKPALTCTDTRQVQNCLLLLTFRIASTGHSLKHRFGVCLSVRLFKLHAVARRYLRRRGQHIFRPFCPMVDRVVTPATSAGLMPTEARGNYLPEAAYFRETKTYLNCNSRMQCMSTSNMSDYQHNTTISVQFSSPLSQLQ